MEMRQIVEKGTYARMRYRSPAALSHWIRDGKLTAPALVEVGGRELVDVAAADVQLAGLLDPSQQLAQPHPITALAPTTPRPSLEQLLDARTAGELHVEDAVRRWLPTLAAYLAARTGVAATAAERALLEAFAEFQLRPRRSQGDGCAR